MKKSPSRSQLNTANESECVFFGRLKRETTSASFFVRHSCWWQADKENPPPKKDFVRVTSFSPAVIILCVDIIITSLRMTFPLLIETKNHKYYCAND